MRLMTWNILHGGKDRLPAIIEVVQAVRPDILALQELRDWQGYGSKRLQDFAASVGMTPHLAPSVFGQPVAVLVRPPIVLTRRSSVTWRLHHAAAEVTIPTEAGPLTVVSTHLNPISPYRRMREARWLAARHASRRGLVAVVGDMNGLAPGEDHSAALAALPDVYRRRHLTGGEADTRAIEAFRSAGFTDLGRGGERVGEPGGEPGGEPTVPTTGLRGPEFGSTRLDYVLASAALAARARDLSVVRGGAAENASDHYPVRVDFDLRG